MDSEKNVISRKYIISAKTDMQITMRRNEKFIIKTTYTMAKLTEALRGQNSMSEPRQQLPATKHADA